MAHENGDKQRPTKIRHVQGMLDETDPLTVFSLVTGLFYILIVVLLQELIVFSPQVTVLLCIHGSIMITLDL